MATTVLQSKEEFNGSLEDKKLEKPLQKSSEWDLHYEPLPFSQALGWSEIAKLRGQPVPKSSMEISALGGREETDFDENWKSMMFTWRDNELLGQILDDLYSETETQQTDLVKHIDLVDYADLMEYKNISFTIDGPITITFEEHIESMTTEQSKFQITEVLSHPEKKEQGCYTLKLMKIPF